MKHLASGENNFSDVHEEPYRLPPSQTKHSPRIFPEHLLHRLYSVDAHTYGRHYIPRLAYWRATGIIKRPGVST